jgi:hypothetical protein
MILRLASLLFSIQALFITNIANAEEANTSPQPAEVSSEQIDKSSEFIYQPQRGNLDVTPNILLGITGASYKGTGGVKQATASIPIGVIVEYGLTSMFSVGLNLKYGSSSTSFSCDSGYTCPKSYTRKGLMDPSLYLTARIPTGPGSIRFGSALKVSIEK